MNHIQHQLLKLITVGLLRLDRLSLLIQIGDLFLHHMERQLSRHDLL